MSLNSGCGLLQGGFKCGTVEAKSDKCTLQVLFERECEKDKCKCLVKRCQYGSVLG
jgi:hypothetical protein